MVLKFTTESNEVASLELGETPITIGRSPDADIQLEDDKASRFHCGIRLWDGDYVLKDLKSKNGTYVNEQRVDVVRLNPGDVIRIGSTLLHADRTASKGTTTIFREVDEQLDEGKGYRTMLRQIVDEAEHPE